MMNYKRLEAIGVQEWAIDSKERNEIRDSPILWIVWINFWAMCMNNELSLRDKQWGNHLPCKGRKNKVNDMRGGNNS